MQKPLVPSWPLIFRRRNFLRYLIFKLFISSAQMFWSFRFHISPKLLCFINIRFLVYPRVFFTYLEFSFVILKGSVCLYCSTLFRYLLSLSSFATIFWSNSSNCTLRLACCFVLIFSSLNTLACFSFLGTFVLCRSFYSWPSCQISHASNVFLFGFPKGQLIFSQTSFTLA